MSQHKALHYAEDTIGVHRTWADAETLVSNLQSDYAVLAGMETEVRDLNLKIERRKQDILIRESEANPGAAVAAQERAIKLAHAKDEDLLKLQELLNDAMGNRDVMTAKVRGHEANLKAHNARLNELGGYFQYLAATKTAQMATLAQAAEWPY